MVELTFVSLCQSLSWNELSECHPFKGAPWEAVSSFYLSYDTPGPLLWQVPSE